MEKALPKKRKTISPIWILPIISLIVGGWLWYQSVQQKGIDITLKVETAAGITAGKTQVIFKGLPVGLVKDITVSDDLKSVILHIEMNKKAAQSLVEDTLFWIVEPEVSVTKIEGLDTLLTGNYIGVVPGKSKKRRYHYTAVDNPPVIFDDAQGLHLVLISKGASMHNAGSPILYKKIQVGEIKEVHLNKDNNVQMEVLIFNQYRHLINGSTLFWDFSGIEVDANLPKIKFKLGTIASLFSGGVTFTTPQQGQKLTTKTFTLFEDYDQALRSDYIPVTFSMPSQNAVEEGAAIKYRNNQIGTITKVTLGTNFKSLVARGLISKEGSKLLRKDSYFWMVRPQIRLSGVHNLDAVLTGTYLSVLPGTGKASRNFVVHDTPPAYIPEDGGLDLILVSDTLGSVKRGSPVNYRKVMVGHVTGYELSPDRHNVLIHINIQDRFANLITPNTKFWNSSGIRIDGGLMTSMSISIDSLETVIVGGISFATPPVKEKKDKNGAGEKVKVKSAKVKPGARFDLYDKPDDDWLEWQPDIAVKIDSGKGE